MTGKIRADYFPAKDLKINGKEDSFPKFIDSNAILTATYTFNYEQYDRIVTYDLDETTTITTKTPRMKLPIEDRYDKYSGHWAMCAYVSYYNKKGDLRGAGILLGYGVDDRLEEDVTDEEASSKRFKLLPTAEVGSTGVTDYVEY